MYRRRAKVIGGIGGLIVLLAVFGLYFGTRRSHDKRVPAPWVEIVSPATSRLSPPAQTSPVVTPPAVTTPANRPPPPQPLVITKPSIDLTNWKLALPIDTSHAGNPDEITQPELASYSSPYFKAAAGGGLQFQAPVSGATTSNSHYPRSELREMTDQGRKEAAWSDTSGTHTMTLEEAITHLPAVKSEVVGAQIHDASDDVIEVRLEGRHLFVESNGKNVGDLDNEYNLGTKYSVVVEAAGGHIKVSYNGVPKVDYAKAGSGYYFKAGCYTQSNTTKGDAANDYGEVIVYSLQVRHT